MNKESTVMEEYTESYESPEEGDTDQPGVAAQGF